MLSHGVRRNLPKLLAALRSGLLLLRLGPGGSGGLPERTARFSTCYELRDLPCRTRGGYFLATLLPMRFPIASLGRWRALSRCDGWRFQTHTGAADVGRQRHASCLEQRPDDASGGRAQGYLPPVLGDRHLLEPIKVAQSWRSRTAKLWPLVLHPLTIIPSSLAV